ncbi:hypothetical protein [Caldisericum sp.]|uniref:hypothetical protein n=1 Tax=Caldisericum sp. TaxID=2499687 RepID=UPI003D121F7B
MKREEILKRLVEELKEVSRRNNDPMDDDEECYYLVKTALTMKDVEELIFDSYEESWPEWLTEWILTTRELYRGLYLLGS